MKTIKNVSLSDIFIKIFSMVLILILLIIVINGISIFTNKNLVYKNQTYGFQVEYPKTWEFSSEFTINGIPSIVGGSDFFNVMFLKKGVDYSGYIPIPIEILVSKNEKKLSLDQIIKEREETLRQNDIRLKECTDDLCVNMRANIDSESRTTFAGADAYREVISPKINDSPYKVVTEKHTIVNSRFIFRIYRGMTSDGVHNQRDIDNIINSFEFLD